MSKGFCGNAAIGWQNSGFAPDTNYYAAFGTGSQATTGNDSTEAHHQAKMGAATTISALSVTLQSPSASSPFPTATLRVNSTSKNNTVAMSSTVGVYSDSTHTDSVASGDLVNITRQHPSHGGDYTIWNTNFMMDMGSGNPAAVMMSAGQNQSISGTSVTDYRPLIGWGPSGTTEQTYYKLPAPTGFTVSMMDVNVRSNTRTDTTTFAFRKNASTGNSTVAFTTTTTGHLVDSTHTDSVTATDLVNNIYSVSTGSGSLGFDQIAYLFTGLGTNFWILGSTGTSNFLGGASQFINLHGYISQNGTEAQATCNVPLGITFSKFTGTASSGTATHVVRVNGVTGNQTITWTSSTPVTDATHSDSAVANDHVNYECTSGSNVQTVQYAMQADTGGGGGGSHSGINVIIFG